MDSYKKCMETSSPKKLCKRGYCTAKSKFKSYPSAYANGFAVKVCKGEADDYEGKRILDSTYTPKGESSLRRWYKEEWVNVCAKGNGPGGYQMCARKNPSQKYPYCRPYNKLPGTKVVSVRELSASEKRKMCKKKKSSKRIVLPRSRSASPRKIISNKKIKIPASVKKDAKRGIELMDLGFTGGTTTGWNRAKQLAYDDYIDPYSLSVMRAWYARHGPDARNGGTSYPGYRKWVEAGRPINNIGKNELRGAVSWLIWGGDAAYKWLKTDKIRKLLKSNYPSKKQSSKTIKLRL